MNGTTGSATAVAPGNAANTFTWNPDQINALVNKQAEALRVVRQALKPIGTQGTYVNSVLGHRVDRDKTLTVRPCQHLQPLLMCRYLSLFREQLNDSDALQALALHAAADIAQAEDAVILLGADAGAFLAKLKVELDQPSELGHQEGLFDKGQKDVGQPILDSILEGIHALRTRGQFGAYYAIVSPTLHQEAYTNQKTPLDAPINQIQSQLADNGFLSCEAASGKKGVIFSLARATINLAVPMDTYLERLTDDDKGPRFRVAQQFRLIIDDREAREALK
jgi:hypothetical protein